MPYSTALTRAMPSPNAISPADLCGNEPLFLSFDPLRSMVLIKTIPAREASTPRSFLRVNFSTRKMVPKSRVKMLLVLVRMVLDATVVYSRQAATK